MERINWLQYTSSVDSTSVYYIYQVSVSNISCSYLVSNWPDLVDRSYVYTFRGCSDNNYDLYNTTIMITFVLSGNKYPQTLLRQINRPFSIAIGCYVLMVDQSTNGQ